MKGQTRRLLQVKSEKEGSEAQLIIIMMPPGAASSTVAKVRYKANS